MKEKVTTIELTEQEAKQFLSFRKYQDIFTMLESARALGTKNGSVTLHFNANGAVTGVAKEEHFNNIRVFHL